MFTELPPRPRLLNRPDPIGLGIHPVLAPVPHVLSSGALGIAHSFFKSSDFEGTDFYKKIFLLVLAFGVFGGAAGSRVPVAEQRIVTAETPAATRWPRPIAGPSRVQ